ncbi:MAG: hypothetical protein ABIF17_02140 [Patescibacteria group bacterium]
MFHKKTLLTLAVFVLILVAGISTSLAYGGNLTGDVDNNNLRNGSKFDPARHEAMQQVFETGDYNAWLKLVDGQPIAEKITAENFGQFIKMHQLMKSGDYESAKLIADELGLQGRGIRGFGKRGMGKFFQNGGKFVDQNGDGICDWADLSEKN